MIFQNLALLFDSLVFWLLNLILVRVAVLRTVTSEGNSDEDQCRYL